MTYGSWWVSTICFFAICAAIVTSPLWGAWLVGGMVADKLERRRVNRCRSSEMLKGML